MPPHQSLVAPLITSLLLEKKYVPWFCEPCGLPDPPSKYYDSHDHAAIEIVWLPRSGEWKITLVRTMNRLQKSISLLFCKRSNKISVFFIFAELFFSRPSVCKTKTKKRPQLLRILGDFKSVKFVASLIERGSTHV